MFIAIGYLIINGREYTGQAGGSFVGLDLVENLFLGGVPDYAMISRYAGFREGFVGKLFVHVHMSGMCIFHFTARKYQIEYFITVYIILIDMCLCTVFNTPV